MAVMNNGPPSTLELVLERIRTAPARGATKLVAIDGRTGSGKTTLARRLRELDRSLRILPLDHFPCREDEHPFGPAGIQTYVSEARVLMTLLPLIAGGAGVFESTSWYDPYRDARAYRVDCGGTVLIEGTYSLLPSLRSLYDLTLWVECTPEESASRATATEPKDPMDSQRWFQAHAPNQERYVDVYRPGEIADITVRWGSDWRLEIVRPSPL